MDIIIIVERIVVGLRGGAGYKEEWNDRVERGKRARVREKRDR